MVSVIYSKILQQRGRGEGEKTYGQMSSVAGSKVDIWVFIVLFFLLFYISWNFYAKTFLGEKKNFHISQLLISQNHVPSENPNKPLGKRSNPQIALSPPPTHPTHAASIIFQRYLRDHLTTLNKPADDSTALFMIKFKFLKMRHALGPFSLLSLQKSHQHPLSSFL